MVNLSNKIAGRIARSAVGKVLFVTNLSDSGPGSLREAVEAKGPRTVIFRVGGVIETKGLVIREPYITIAGQTAPGDGICINKTESSGDAFALSGTHDVIIRHCGGLAFSTFRFPQHLIQHFCRGTCHTMPFDVVPRPMSSPDEIVD